MYSIKTLDQEVHKTREKENEDLMDRKREIRRAGSIDKCTVR